MLRAGEHSSVPFLSPPQAQHARSSSSGARAAACVPSPCNFSTEFRFSSARFTSKAQVHRDLTHTGAQPSGPVPFAAARRPWFDPPRPRKANLFLVFPCAVGPAHQRPPVPPRLPPLCPVLATLDLDPPVRGPVSVRWVQKVSRACAAKLFLQSGPRD